MAWLLIVIGLISAAGGVWMAGDERVVCRAAASSPSNAGRPAADCRIQVRRFWGTQLYREHEALGVEEFGVFKDREQAPEPNDPPKITFSLEMAARDGSRYHVAANPAEVDAAVVEARRWLSRGMDGEFVFISDAFGRGRFACLLGAGCFLGGVVGLLVGSKKPPG